MASSTYQIADRDEFEAFGHGGHPSQDTSAGLNPGDEVPTRMAEADAASSVSRRRKCVAIVFTLSCIAGVAIFLAVLLTQPSKSSSPQNNDGSPLIASPSPTPPPVAGTIEGKPEKAPTYTVSVISKLPHDRKAFLQGFEYSNGKFYEGTGLYGRSSLRLIQPENGTVLQRYDFPGTTLFGEGITLHKDEHIFMLTWQAGRGLIFNQSTLELISEWKYKGEGWGLTMDREKDEVYMSDGTSELRVLDPGTMDEKRRVVVTLNGRKVRMLNELEWVCGEVWSNVWQSNEIYRIDPVSGVVKSVLDVQNLPQEEDRTRKTDVLNGIAFDPDTGRLWLTGKLWKTIYQVTISDPSLDLTACK